MLVLASVVAKCRWRGDQKQEFDMPSITANFHPLNMKKQLRPRCLSLSIFDILNLIFYTSRLERLAHTFCYPLYPHVPRLLAVSHLLSAVKCSVLYYNSVIMLSEFAIKGFLNYKKRAMTTNLITSKVTDAIVRFTSPVIP